MKIESKGAEEGTGEKSPASHSERMVEGEDLKLGCAPPAPRQSTALRWEDNECWVPPLGHLLRSMDPLASLPVTCSHSESPLTLPLSTHADYSLHPFTWPVVSVRG